MSSPVRKRPGGTLSQTASQATQDLLKHDLVSHVSGEDFLRTHLSWTGDYECHTWTGDLQGWVDQVEDTSGNEISLYTEDAPLLRLLNAVSEKIRASLASKHAPALTFRSCHNQHVLNPFGPSLKPDIVVLREDMTALKKLTGNVENPDFACTKPSWHGLVAVGEVKVQKDAPKQLGNYLRNHLQLRPDKNAVLGFTARSEGYRLFYHDATAIHCSTLFKWIPGPLYAFIRQLYEDPFSDPTMAMLGTKNKVPTWITKVGDRLFASSDPKPQPGPGQRRYVTKATLLGTSESWFIKDVWRDEGRRFFEGLLYEKAHKGQHLPGLMTADDHGYVLDAKNEPLRTTSLKPGPGGQSTIARCKMRMLTKDVGEPLENIRSLRQFLSVMYDVCVVQRNLFRKSHVLHRDISDNNIMIAPTNDEFHERCANGYCKIPYLNQMLAKNRDVKPKPACLVIDLGNGADLDVVQADPGALAARTGTPKFIARSVSSGKLMDFEQHATQQASVSMPVLEGRALELYEFSQTKEKYERFTRMVLKGYEQKQEDKPDIRFAHQLFHDAESVFWVIVWVLVRSARSNYAPGSDEWTQELTELVSAMETQEPGQTSLDHRKHIVFLMQGEWENNLHPDLKCMAPMLAAMSKYIRPEWAYRPELDADHVQEALMRLLLTEIVRIDDSEDGDIELAVGIRALPHVVAPKQSSQSCSASNSRFSTPPQSTNSNLSNPKKRSSSHLGDEATSSSAPARKSLRLIQRREMNAGLSEETVKAAQKHDWSGAGCQLRRPDPPNQEAVVAG